MFCYTHQIISYRNPQYVDLKHLGNIRAVRVPQYSPYAVAEHATALLLNINRKKTTSYPFASGAVSAFNLDLK